MAPPPITNGMMSQGPPPGNPNLLTALSSEKMYPPGYNMVFNSQNPNAPPIYPCGNCRREVHEDEQAILCESGCNFWFHRVCSGLQEFAFRMLAQETYAEWVCDTCFKTKNVPTVVFKRGESNWNNPNHVQQQFHNFQQQRYSNNASNSQIRGASGGPPLNSSMPPMGQGNFYTGHPGSGQMNSSHASTRMMRPGTDPRMMGPGGMGPGGTGPGGMGPRNPRMAQRMMGPGPSMPPSLNNIGHQILNLIPMAETEKDNIDGNDMIDVGDLIAGCPLEYLVTMGSTTEPQTAIPNGNLL